MMDVSCFRVGFSLDLASHLTMTVTAFYCSSEPVDGKYMRDSCVLFKTRYMPYDNNYARIANLCIPKRFSEVYHFDAFNPSYLCDGTRPLYESRYNFLYADGIKAMKAALDFYGISWDHHVLGLDDLPI